MVTVPTIGAGPFDMVSRSSALRPLSEPQKNEFKILELPVYVCAAAYIVDLTLQSTKSIAERSMNWHFTVQGSLVPKMATYRVRRAGYEISRQKEPCQARQRASIAVKICRGATRGIGSAIAG
jgi:hypothetical protein